MAKQVKTEIKKKLNKQYGKEAQPMARRMEEVEASEAVVDMTPSEGEASLAVTKSAEQAAIEAMELDESALAKLVEAPKEHFVQPDSDFWKPSPSDVGTPAATKRGVYMGSYKGSDEYMVHVLGTVDSKTKKALKVRINGTQVLTRELGRREKGQAIEITYKGQTKSAGGYNVALWEVRDFDPPRN